MDPDPPTENKETPPSHVAPNDRSDAYELRGDTWTHSTYPSSFDRLLLVRMSLNCNDGDVVGIRHEWPPSVQETMLAVLPVGPLVDIVRGYHNPVSLERLAHHSYVLRWLRSVNPPALVTDHVRWHDREFGLSLVQWTEHAKVGARTRESSMKPKPQAFVLEIEPKDYPDAPPIVQECFRLNMYVTLWVINDHMMRWTVYLNINPWWRQTGTGWTLETLLTTEKGWIEANNQGLLSGSSPEMAHGTKRKLT